MRHLITGGAGFLGSNLIERLIKSNEEIVCMDNFFTGNENNVKSFHKFSNFKIVNHDVIEPFEINVDKIWHLACPASPTYYQLNPINTARTSFLGTYNMLELSKKTGAKLLLASSSEIYGNPSVHPQDENYTGSVSTTGLRSCYNEGKRISETLCFDYQRIHNVKICIARIFNSYGPRMQPDDGRVISNFIVQSLKGMNLTIYGNGEQSRSFCYVDDIIDGLIKLMYSNIMKPVNLGNPYEVKILDLANLIRKKINPDLSFVYKVLPDEDPLKRKPKILKAREYLNWEPTISLDNGLDQTINYFKNLLKI